MIYLELHKWYSWNAIAHMMPNLPHYVHGMLWSVMYSILHIPIVTTSADPPNLGGAQSRAWGPLTGDRVIVWHQWSQVGLLPEGGAKRAIYDFQAMIEIARSKDQCLTGITLGFLKCFHQSKQSQVITSTDQIAKILRHFGPTGRCLFRSCHGHQEQWTSSFTNGLGLEIDRGKTWQWASGLHPAPNAKFTRVQAAWDHRYQGLKERLSQAKDRSGRIQRARWALRSESRHLWKCVSSSTLYASEPLGLGQSHLDLLRTAIANAVVGDTCQSMNLALFLSCLDFRLVDPHLPFCRQWKKFAVFYIAVPQNSCCFRQRAAKLGR